MNRSRRYRNSSVGRYDRRIELAPLVLSIVVVVVIVLVVGILVHSMVERAHDALDHAMHPSAPASPR